MIKHKPFKLTGEVETVEINMFRAIMRLANKGTLTFSGNECTGILSGVLITNKGKVLVSTGKPQPADAVGYISPIAMCLCDLLGQERASRA